MPGPARPVARALRGATTRLAIGPSRHPERGLLPAPRRGPLSGAGALGSRNRPPPPGLRCDRSGRRSLGRAARAIPVRRGADRLEARPRAFPVRRRFAHLRQGVLGTRGRWDRGAAAVGRTRAVPPRRRAARPGTTERRRGGDPRRRQTHDAPGPGRHACHRPARRFSRARGPRDCARTGVPPRGPLLRSAGDDSYQPAAYFVQRNRTAPGHSDRTLHRRCAPSCVPARQILGTFHPRRTRRPLSRHDPRSPAARRHVLRIRELPTRRLRPQPAACRPISAAPADGHGAVRSARLPMDGRSHRAAPRHSPRTARRRQSFLGPSHRPMPRASQRTLAERSRTRGIRRTRGRVSPQSSGTATARVGRRRRNHPPRPRRRPPHGRMLRAPQPGLALSRTRPQ